MKALLSWFSAWRDSGKLEIQALYDGRPITITLHGSISYSPAGDVLIAEFDYRPSFDGQYLFQHMHLTINNNSWPIDFRAHGVSAYAANTIRFRVELALKVTSSCQVSLL